MPAFETKHWEVNPDTFNGASVHRLVRKSDARDAFVNTARSFDFTSKWDAEEMAKILEKLERCALINLVTLKRESLLIRTADGKSTPIMRTPVP